MNDRDATKAQNNKRLAPISSSAFSFSLQTPVGKRTKPAATPTPSQSVTPRQYDKADVTTPIKIQPPRLKETLGESSKRSFNSRSPLQNPLQTPTRPTTTPLRRFTDYATLDVRPSPLSLRQRSDHETVSISSLTPRRKINAVLDDDHSPFRLGNRATDKALDERSNFQNISAISGGVVLEDILELPKKNLMDEEEGLGVSPRKSKGAIQHKGPGPPLTVQLVTISSSSKSSLILFYTSLQQSLCVTAPQRASLLASHIASAPLRLRIIAPLPGPTHSSAMFRASVVHWKGRDPMMARNVLVVFSALPNDCPHVGVDARALATAPRTNKLFESGLWAPWSEAIIPDTGGEFDEDCMTVFTTRYIVTEMENQ